VHAKFEVPEIIAFGVLGGVRTPNLGKGEVVGDRGWYRSKERRPPIITFSLSLRVSEILPLLCS